LYHFCIAQITLGKIEFTRLTLPSRDNSQIKTEFFKYSLSFIFHVLLSIQTAIGKSKETQDFLISAGAKFTVILVAGSLKLDDFKALLSLSLLS
jgi:hypothetical protein